MEKLNFEQIEKIILELDKLGMMKCEEWMQGEIAEVEDLDRDWDPVPKQNHAEIVRLLTELGTIKGIKHHGGEGQGDEYWCVVKFVDHDVMIQFYGSYASYSGSYYDGMRQVFPVERMVTFYEPKKD